MRKIDRLSLILPLLLASGCISYHLPDHRYCFVAKGDPDQDLQEQEGQWVNVSAGTYHDKWFPYLGSTKSYYLRKNCLESNKIPVILNYVMELDYCVLPQNAPKGCQ